MSKTISMCGMERGDAAYYLAVSLSKADKTVLVVDNSRNHDIYTAVSDDLEPNAKFVVKQNITYVKNALINEEYNGVFDYVIVWHGMNVNKTILENSNFIYVLPNYERSVLKAIGSQIEDKEAINALILRDSVFSNKISDKKVASTLGMPAEKVKFTLVYDSKDYENYLAFAYNGRQTFNNLTPVFNECLVSMIADVMELDTKRATAIFKKAKSAQGN